MSEAARPVAAGEPQATPESPWLGLAHFAEADCDYFFGREAEVRELTERVRRAPLAVIYGVSGYGKSSILGAGLIPALRAAGHPIVLLRRCYDDLAERPLQDDVIAACVAAIPGCHAPDQAEGATLWEFFHDSRQPWFQRPAADPESDQAEPTEKVSWPVLILDQFEEIFIKGEDRSTHDAAGDERAQAAAHGFLTQLADLVENRPPAALQERLQSGRSEERRALVRRYDFQACPVRVAVGVRDDFLGRLERWRRAMPALMEHRVELRRLSGPQAYRAVFEPGAKRPGQPPIIPSEVAAAIVRAAAGAAPETPLEEIDAVPPILSLLCERLNDRRLAASPPPASITADDFSPGEADRILGRFYDDHLRPHPKALREYLEDELVSDSGFRENVTLDSAVTSLRDVIPDVERRLRQLVDDRVLVIEDRGGIPRVELTHDTLARLALERRRGRKARARRLRAAAWSMASLAVAGVSLGLAAWALRAEAEAGRQAKKAQEQTKIARANADEAAIQAKRAQEQTGIARARAEEAEREKAGALGLIRFMDAQVGEAFVDAVPLQLRERVSARVDAFYTAHGSLATFEEHQQMGYQMRKALVHFEMMKGYQKDSVLDEAEKARYINSERTSAVGALNEAIALGGKLESESQTDRGVARDRILAHYYLSLVHSQLSEWDAAADQLEKARKLLDSLAESGAFSLAHYIDWMGLPNVDAAMGELKLARGDEPGGRAILAKAILLQSKLAAIDGPWSDERKTELELLRQRLEQMGGDAVSALSPNDSGDVALRKRESQPLGLRFVSAPGLDVSFSVYETRVKDFRAFVMETGYVHMRETKDPDSRMWSVDRSMSKQRGYAWDDPGFRQTENDPVVGVSWRDARVFCVWLTLRERAAGRLPADREYRLPTDAEWSAAVGLTEEDPQKSPEEKHHHPIPDKYPWGSGWPPPPGAGNYAGTEAADENWPVEYPTIPGYTDGYKRTAPAGSFKPNAFGIYDLGGNVWEWCETAIGPEGAYRVLRGASWGSGGDRSQLLSSYRQAAKPGARYADYGFRCVMGASPPNR